MIISSITNLPILEIAFFCDDLFLKMITNRIFTIGSSLAASYWANAWTKRTFPPDPVPLPLPPLPGNKFFGYMGCAQKTISKIEQKKRLLFFAPTIHVPQFFALSRTSFYARWVHDEKPVVLQIEIGENESIEDENLWHDPRLNQPLVMTMSQLHLWPAIAPDVQKRTGLQIRVHHVVTYNVYQNGGHFFRASHAFFEQFSNDQIWLLL